jgi:hypothetical protein
MIETLRDSIVYEEFDYSLSQTDSSTPSTDVVRWPAEWRDAKVEEIQRFSELSGNWDSYGAAPADPRSIHFAVARIHALATETEEEPRVACLPNGHIMLAWESDDDSRACEVEFLPSGLIRCMVADDSVPELNFEFDSEGLGQLLRCIPGTGL